MTDFAIARLDKPKSDEIGDSKSKSVNRIKLKLGGKIEFLEKDKTHKSNIWF